MRKLFVEISETVDYLQFNNLETIHLNPADYRLLISEINLFKMNINVDYKNAILDPKTLVILRLTQEDKKLVSSFCQQCNTQQDRVVNELNTHVSILEYPEEVKDNFEVGTLWGKPVLLNHSVKLGHLKMEMA